MRTAVPQVISSRPWKDQESQTVVSVQQISRSISKSNIYHVLGSSNSSTSTCNRQRVTAVNDEVGSCHIAAGITCEEHIGLASRNARP